MFDIQLLSVQPGGVLTADTVELGLSLFWNFISGSLKPFNTPTVKQVMLVEPEQASVVQFKHKL